MLLCCFYYYLHVLWLQVMENVHVGIMQIIFIIVLSQNPEAIPFLPLQEHRSFFHFEMY